MLHIIAVISLDFCCYIGSIVFIIAGAYCRQQDEELDELSASVERIGGVGLTIHEELLSQVCVLTLKINRF